ncbi:hypothetical protein PISMIDRAFT_520671 [Pisolithus microcarpus 441]|uniref:Uncharacterized protein n=1 Tax=Pisolithus microcarpus 441 TaxID=765257 RepID=A0A0D0A4A1_9AGAM|nr:hypothetical protein PISMIDRAFT_520671 [Pisolithus microcarpus 441]
MTGRTRRPSVRSVSHFHRLAVYKDMVKRKVPAKILSGFYQVTNTADGELLAKISTPSQT